MMRTISLLLVFCFIALPVGAVVINPSTENQPLWCQFYYTKWICDFGGPGTGGIGPQGIPGINGTGGGDINYFNFSGSNLTTISNITNFFTYSQMNQTANMTAGPQGPPGDIPDSTQFPFLNGTRALTGIWNFGGYNLSNILNPVSPQDATTKAYVDALPIYNASYLTSTYNATYDAKTNFNASYALNTSLITDHGALTGLTDDDHVRYFDKDLSKLLTGERLKRDVDNSRLFLIGGTTEAGKASGIILHGADYAGAPGRLAFFVPNAAKTGLVYMMTVEGVTDTPVTDWRARRLTNIADPTAAQDAATKNYVDTKQKCGATAAVADGGTITHTFGTTPTYVIAQSTISGEFVSVTAKSSTTFTNAIKKYNNSAGTTQTVYWCVG